MWNSQRLIGSILATAWASVVAFPTAGSAQNQVSPADRARVEAEARAQAIERSTRENARRLTLFDRQGHVVADVGDPALSNPPMPSPDATQVAAVQRITASKPREPVQAPAWSPDARHVGFVGLRGSRYGIYRKPVTGDGDEELIYQHAGGPIVLTDWSLDGKMLSFYASDLSGSTLYLVPVDGERTAIEVTRSESQVVAARLSPDGRWLAYRSNEKDNRNQIFVRAVPAPGSGGNTPAGTWQVSTDGGEGMVWWRRDGKELYYIGPQRQVMVVEVRAGQDFEFGKPRLLFTAPRSIPATGNPGAFGSVSRDGERVVFVVPPEPPLRQLTIFDRQGRALRTIGDPGLYTQPSLSPDGSKIAVMRVDPQTDATDIWTYDVDSGRGTPITSTPDGENAPLWLPDGQRIAYVANRNTNYASIYRKAANGQGAEEQLFRYTPGAGMVLTDFSTDGRFLTFDGGGVILVVPLAGDDPLTRQGVDFARSEYEAGLGRFSPDGQYIAYGSNETGRFEVFVRPFDAGAASASGEQKWNISSDGAIGGITWSRDGRELYYLSEDRSTSEIKVMAAAITTAPSFESAPPTVLFRLKGPLPGNPGQWKISPDGQRFVFAVPVSAPKTR